MLGHSFVERLFGFFNVLIPTFLLALCFIDNIALFVSGCLGLRLYQFLSECVVSWCTGM